MGLLVVLGCETVSLNYLQQYAIEIPNVHNANSKPEKLIAAMTMKETNCAIIARSDLRHK